jgi:hypothetical protein
MLKKMFSFTKKKKKTIVAKQKINEEVEFDSTKTYI